MYACQCVSVCVSFVHFCEEMSGKVPNCPSTCPSFSSPIHLEGTYGICSKVLAKLENLPPRRREYVLVLLIPVPFHNFPGMTLVLHKTTWDREDCLMVSATWSQRHGLSDTQRGKVGKQIQLGQSIHTFSSVALLDSRISSCTSKWKSGPDCA